jgi:serine protease Do
VKVFSMKFTLRKYSLALALLLPFGVPAAIFAQDQAPEEEYGEEFESDDPELDDEEAEEEDDNPARQFFRQFRGFGRRSENEKTAPAVKAAFREIASPASRSTALIFAGDEPSALGTVVSADGYILTKASELHDALRARFKDGREFPATLVGIHDEHDLAMLKVDADDLTPVAWNKDVLPSLGTFLVTVGLADEPEAIGVVSAITRKINGLPGILGVNLEEGDGGPRIAQVLPKSGAEKAGLLANDIVLKVNDKEVKTREEMITFVRTFRAGNTLTLKIRRGSEEKEIRATLGSPTSIPALRGAFQDEIGGNLSERRAGFAEALQHDTVLEPHQCGGPVIDLDGKAVGVNIARAGRVASYALPARVVLAVVDDLKAGKFAPPPEPTKVEKIAELDKRLAEMTETVNKRVEERLQAEAAMQKAEESLKAAQAAVDAAKAGHEQSKRAVDDLQGELEKLKAERKALDESK